LENGGVKPATARVNSGGKRESQGRPEKESVRLGEKRRTGQRAPRQRRVSIPEAGGRERERLNASTQKTDGGDMGESDTTQKGLTRRDTSSNVRKTVFSKRGGNRTKRERHDGNEKKNDERCEKKKKKGGSRHAGTKQQLCRTSLQYEEALVKTPRGGGTKESAQQPTNFYRERRKGRATMAGHLCSQKRERVGERGKKRKKEGPTPKLGKHTT